MRSHHPHRSLRKGAPELAIVETLIGLVFYGTAVATGVLFFLWVAVRGLARLRKSPSRANSPQTSTALWRLEHTPPGHRALGWAWVALTTTPSASGRAQVVLHLLAHPRPAYHFIASLLHASNYRDAHTFFEGILSEPHRRLRDLALLGLSRAAAVDPSLRPLLLEEAASADPKRQLAAVRPLLATYAEEASPPLGLLADLATAPDWRIRAACASALGRWDSPLAGQYLRHLLRDPQWTVRHAAARTLAGQHGGWRALHASAHDPDPFAADMALDAFQWLPAATTFKASVR